MRRHTDMSLAGHHYLQEKQQERGSWIINMLHQPSVSQVTYNMTQVTYNMTQVTYNMTQVTYNIGMLKDLRKNLANHPILFF